MQIISFLYSAVLGASLCAPMCAQALGTRTETRPGGLERSGELKPGETPQGLSTAEWASIQAKIAQNLYRFEPSEQSIIGANLEQRWTINFDAHGLSLDLVDRAAPKSVGRAGSQRGHAIESSPRKPGLARHPGREAGLKPDPPSPGADRSPNEIRESIDDRTNKSRIASGLRLTTTAIGRTDAPLPVNGAMPVVRDNKVELRHAQATEWYVNSALGLEHGYTFGRPPRGERGEVRIQLAVDGAFKAQPATDGVWFIDASGTRRLRYHKLLVVDANHRTLDARLDVQAEDSLQIAFDDTHALYPVTVDPLLVNQEAKLVAEDGAVGDNFGYAVSVSGNTAVVGVPGDDIDNIGGRGKQGSAYVFVRADSTWNLQDKLIAPDDEVAHGFGNSVAVSGDTVVVGAPGDSVGGFAANGSVYVFVRSGGTWNQQAKLFADDAENGDLFGNSVAVSGDTAVVGAFWDDIGANPEQGSAYVFARSSDSTWSQQAKLLASDGDISDLFGKSVAVSGDTAVVGASAIYLSYAYVFVRNGSTWHEQAKLLAADGVNGDHFGNSVAVSGDTAVIGAVLDDNVNFNSGSAYVFVRDGSIWSQQAQLIAGDVGNSDYFGHSVALSGDTAVVAAPSDFRVSSKPGSAYVFVRSGSAWNQQTQLLAADGDLTDSFGFSVALSGDTAVAGTPFDDIDANDDQGSAYVYRAPESGPASDFGDAPAPYPTLLVEDGARHPLSGPRLGFTIDAEPDGLPTSEATGDDLDGIDDEDGVQFSTLNAGQPAAMDVIVNLGPALLDAWIDFNRDGDWADAGEQIFDNVSISFPGLFNVNNHLTFDVPADASVGPTYARVRVSSDGVSGVTGAATDGEVQDESVNITVASLSVSDASVTEGNSGDTSLLGFTVSLSDASPTTVLVDVATANGSATLADGDYTEVVGTLEFRPGQTSETVFVAVHGDTRLELDETLSLTLSNPVGAIIYNGSATGTIFNDDAPPPDTTPDPFGFVSVTNVDRGTAQTSNSITVSGINTSAPIEVTDGEYSVGCNAGSFTVAAATIDDGQTVCVRHTSSTSFSGSVTTTLSIGGVTGSFISTTVAEDTTPDAYIFDDANGVSRNVIQTSNTVIVSGINSDSPISVVDGLYSINDGPFGAGMGAVQNGDSVRVRHTSAAGFSTTVTTTLDIGGVTGSFSSTTEIEDTTPDPFTFQDQTGVLRGFFVTSNVATITGINSDAAVSISGSSDGTYSVNGGPFGTTPGIVHNGDTVQLRNRVKLIGLSRTSTVTITIGGVSDTWSITSLL